MKQETEPVLELYVDVGGASKETLVRLLTALSALHIAHGGTGLKFEAVEGGGGLVRARENVDV